MLLNPYVPGYPLDECLANDMQIWPTTRREYNLGQPSEQTTVVFPD